MIVEAEDSLLWRHGPANAADAAARADKQFPEVM